MFKVRWNGWKKERKLYSEFQENFNLQDRDTGLAMKKVSLDAFRDAVSKKKKKKKK